jgi:hypothetical protein
MAGGAKAGQTAEAAVKLLKTIAKGVLTVAG